MTHTTYPVSIPLPNGLRAELVYALPLHDPPVYAIDGVPVWLDVTVPADLRASGWFWNGALLTLQNAQCDIHICTASSPPPLWNVARDGRILVPGLWPCCFVVARFLNVRQREFGERRVAELAAKAAKMKRAPAVRRPVAVQTMMELG